MKTTFKHLGAKLSLCVLSALLAFSLEAAETNSAGTFSLDNFTNSPAHNVRPSRENGIVANLTAELLRGLHFTHHPFDTDYSKLFFHQYLEMFDPQHIHFLQSDIEEFDHYSTNLNRLIIGDNLDRPIIDRPYIADTSPAYDIFKRFLLRLEQRTAYAEELLKTEKFDFTSDDKIVTDRHEMPYPKDLDAAKQLWRERVCYEYLQEKIARIASERRKTNSIASKPPTVIVPNVSETNGVVRVDWSNTTTNTLVTLSSNTPPKTITETLLTRSHRNLRVFEDWDGNDVLQTFLTALARVYDPHSEYLGPVAGDNFAQQMNLGFYGIGAELTVSDDGNEYCTIRRLMPGGPAIKDGRLKDGDRIVAVAQGDAEPVDVVGMSLTKVVQLIKGPKDTEVRLTVMHAGSPERQPPISIIRDKIPLEEQAAKAKLIELPGANGKATRIGVIDLPSFYAPVSLGNAGLPPEDAHYTSVDVEKLLRKLESEKVDGVILDLRRNGGGSLEEAIKLTGLFIKDGPVVQVKNSDPRGTTVQVYEDRDPSITYDGPLIVMTSRFSASASEIVAGALQDYGRALIVGDISTHGKGTVQSVNRLQDFMRRSPAETSEPGSLKVTRSMFYRASGASTQFKGVMPDIVLPSVLNHVKDIGEQSLDYALKWDTIDKAQFEPVNRTIPYITDLLKRSTERVAANQDFAYVREDIEQVIRRQADKTASLNEQTVLKEVDTEEARKAARDKERASRKPSGEINYDITLKQVDLPGLPPPVGATNSVTGIIQFIETNSTALAVNGLDLDPKIASTFVTTNTIPLIAPSAKAVTTPVAPPQTESERADNARLKETTNIMVDYLSLLAQHSIATTARPGSTVPPPTP